MIWITNGDPISPEAERALGEMAGHPRGVLVSPISAWEVGLLAARGRFRAGQDPADWFHGLVDRGFALADLTPRIFVASSFLPDSRLRDPADRIVVATARTFGYRIMTRDRLILGFAAEGHAQAIAC
ncbi:MAG: type II toxin-antitoxin system VapC family toxin [Phenylobacterium sp.]|nr:type II toxin-antitoxin system VapC family toxin [Phenylobacterium sp.]